MTFPSAAQLQTMLDQCRPVTVLKELQGEVPPELAIYKAQALLYLDSVEEASRILEPLMEHLQGDELVQAKRYWSQILLHKHQVDEAIFVANSAVRAAQSNEARAHAMVELAIGYSRKYCWQLAENTLRDAKALAGPRDPSLLLGEAHLRLEKDERLAARAVYEQLAECKVPWAPIYSDWGRSTVALLLGDFVETRERVKASLQASDEMIWPYYVSAHLSIIEEDVQQLGQILDEIARRSPQASALPALQSELARLQKRQSTPVARRRRLKAFPTTMQKRNYCGPSTIDLILRFWKSSEEFTDDQIAAYVKLPHGGTPAYRMQEFFHLVGFDTLRCIAPIEKLKQLIDAGYPVIVAEEFPDNTHVTVVIGYDEADHLIEFQDPMTHQVIALPEEIVNNLRRTYLDAALVAYPHGKGYDKELARLGFFDEPAVIWTDQAGLEMEKGNFQDVARGMERAVQRLPTHQLSWIIWLSAEMEDWRRAAQKPEIPRSSLVASLVRDVRRPAQARQSYYRVLQRARELHPDSKFVHVFAGQGAYQDGDVQAALAAFKRASEIDPADSGNFAAMADCHFSLRQTDQALEAAQEGIKRNPTSPSTNLWLGRCLAMRGDEKAEHYLRCTLELAPNWWLAHQAMAELFLSKHDNLSARRELNLALAMEPRQPQASIQRALLDSMEGYHVLAVLELEQALRRSKNLPPYAEYNARQTLCRELFSSREFHQARNQVRKLLKLCPGDSWALQFLAAATSEMLVRRRHFRSNAARNIRRLYAPAIQANQANSRVVADYLNYLGRLEKSGPVLKEIARLRLEYPENKSLLALHARWLSRVGQREPAARLMLEAVGSPAGIRNADDLYGAAQIILAGLGAEAGEQSLLSGPAPEGTPSLSERQRALGLVLALNPKENGARARELLQAVLEDDPRDAYAVLRLGDVTNDARQREEQYRHALRISPEWPFIRAYLASYLMDSGRADEALEFTAGHQNDSVDVMIMHGRALFLLGRYDEAVPVYQAGVDAKERPESWLYYDLWEAESRSGDHRAALHTARRALSHYRREVRWYPLVATSLRNQGRFHEAARVIQQGQMFGLKWPDYLESEYETAWARGRYRAALRLEEKLAKWEKSDEGKYWTRSRERRFRLLLKLKRPGQAREMLYGEVLDSPDELGQAAWICMDTASWDLAGELSEKLLALDEHNFVGMFARAESLAETGQLEPAVEALIALRAEHPHEHNSYEKLAVQSALDGNTDQAMEMAERAVLLGPFCPFAWATRGYVYFLRGQWEAARSDLETGWRRADVSRQRENYVFWWILAALQNRPALALYRQIQAGQESVTDWRRRQVAQVRNHLRASAIERFREHPVFQGMQKFIERFLGPLRVRFPGSKGSR